MKINVNSEIGDLEGVIIHTPGQEVENMTPQNAERALYSDILNLSVASEEYSQFKTVLEKLTNVYEISDLLETVLNDEKARIRLVNKICGNENSESIEEDLLELNSKDLTRQLIQGVPISKQSNLTKFLSVERYELQPLHNFFFTRDASISVGNSALIGNLANQVREREALIMDSIFNCSKLFETSTINPSEDILSNKITIEGGDVLVARDDILIIGTGARTTTYGIDYLIKHFKISKKEMNLIVQVLPKEPESFIHLDMVFTILDINKCLIYPPVILNQHAYETVHISISNGKVKQINEEKNILAALSKLGMELEPISCGGNSDEWIQEREQWHSGANFFSVGPGKIIGYGRNQYTVEAINKAGFEVIKVKDVINGNYNLDNYNKYLVTIDGSELARGGGGARCMTMPISRKD